MCGVPKPFFFQLPLLLICLLPAAGAYAQEREEPGKPTGKFSIVGKLILMELNEGALGREKLFDPERHTLRFTPAHDGYRVENLPLEWDADLGRKITEPQVALHNFSFPFSGKRGMRSAPVSRDRFASANRTIHPALGGELGRHVATSQDATWTNAVNRFQTVLHKDGAIEMSYDQLAAKDAIIGVYPLVSAEAERTSSKAPASFSEPRKLR